MFSECCRGHEGSLALSPSQCAGLDAHPGSNLRESWSPCCTYQCLWRKTMMFLWLSSQWFQQFLILMQKVLPLFFLFGICLEVYRCWQVASHIFYSAKGLFYCKICTKKEGVLLTGPRSSLWPSATVVCLQVSSLCISGWVLFLNKDFIRQWILVNIYYFCFFLFSLALLLQ